MDDLITFLNARLDEEEAAAALAAKYNPAPWATDGLDDLRDATGAEIFAPGGYEGVSFYDSAARFVARHDPARVLLGVQAKRVILTRLEAVYTAFHDRAAGMWPDVSRRERSHACNTLCDLAAVYSGHPDYDPAWAPPTASVPG